MTDERSFISQYDINDNNIHEIFNIFQERYNFITDGDVIVDSNDIQVFVVPTSINDFRYATAEERYITEHDDTAALCIALTQQQYFDIINNKVTFLPDLNGITSGNEL